MAAEFSLNTQMILLSKRTLWLSDGSMGFGQESDTAFSEGNTATFLKHLENLKEKINENVKRKNNIKGNKYAPRLKYFCECFHCSAAWTSLHSTDQKEIPVWWMVLLIWQKLPPLFTDSTTQQNKMKGKWGLHEVPFWLLPQLFPKQANYENACILCPSTRS